MSSQVPSAVTRPAPTLGPHPLFRQTAIKAYKFDVAAGNNAAETETIISTIQPSFAGLYGVILETGDNTTFGLFRLDDGNTVTIIQDAGADLAATPTDAKVAIYNDSGVLTINNRFGAASTAVAVSVTIFRLSTD
jgi:hypothetical protein